MGRILLDSSLEEIKLSGIRQDVSQQSAENCAHCSQICN